MTRAAILRSREEPRDGKLSHGRVAVRGSGHSLAARMATRSEPRSNVSRLGALRRRRTHLDLWRLCRLGGALCRRPRRARRSARRPRARAHGELAGIPRGLAGLRRRWRRGGHNQRPLQRGRDEILLRGCRRRRRRHATEIRRDGRVGVRGPRLDRHDRDRRRVGAVRRLAAKRSIRRHISGSRRRPASGARSRRAVLRAVHIGDHLQTQGRRLGPTPMRFGALASARRTKTCARTMYT